MPHESDVPHGSDVPQVRVNPPAWIQRTVLASLLSFGAILMVGMALVANLRERRHAEEFAAMAKA